MLPRTSRGTNAAANGPVQCGAVHDGHTGVFNDATTTTRLAQITARSLNAYANIA